MTLHDYHDLPRCNGRFGAIEGIDWCVSLQSRSLNMFDFAFSEIGTRYRRLTLCLHLRNLSHMAHKLNGC